MKRLEYLPRLGLKSLFKNNQCCGSMPDPDLDPRIHASNSDPVPDADPDPDIFVFDLKLPTKTNFFAYYLLKVHLHHFQR
jgi:hypothetical protein